MSPSGWSTSFPLSTTTSNTFYNSANQTRILFYSQTCLQQFIYKYPQSCHIGKLCGYVIDISAPCSNQIISRRRKMPPHGEAHMGSLFPMGKTSWEGTFPWGRCHGKSLSHGEDVIGRHLPMGTTSWGGFFPWGRRHGEAPSHGEDVMGRLLPMGKTSWEARSYRKFCMGSPFL